MGVNYWEYSIITKITYKNEILFKQRNQDSVDSLDKPAPDTIIADGVSIEFESGFEVMD